MATTQNRCALRTLTTAAQSLNAAYAKTFVSVQSNAKVIQTAMHITGRTECILRVSQSVQYLYTELSTLSHKFALLAFFIKMAFFIKIVLRKECSRLLRKIDKRLPLHFIAVSVGPNH